MWRVPPLPVVLTLLLAGSLCAAPTSFSWTLSSTTASCRVASTISPCDDPVIWSFETDAGLQDSTGATCEIQQDPSDCSYPLLCEGLNFDSHFVQEAWNPHPVARVGITAVLLADDAAVADVTLVDASGARSGTPYQLGLLPSIYQARAMPPQLVTGWTVADLLGSKTGADIVIMEAGASNLVGVSVDFLRLDAVVACDVSLTSSGPLYTGPFTSILVEGTFCFSEDFGEEIRCRYTDDANSGYDASVIGGVATTSHVQCPTPFIDLEPHDLRVTISLDSGETYTTESQVVLYNQSPGDGDGSDDNDAPNKASSPSWYTQPAVLAAAAALLLIVGVSGAAVLLRSGYARAPSLHSVESSSVKPANAAVAAKASGKATSSVKAASGKAASVKAAPGSRSRKPSGSTGKKKSSGKRKDSAAAKVYTTVPISGFIDTKRASSRTAVSVKSEQAPYLPEF